VQFTCSIISVLTQWGATLVMKIRERERVGDANLSFALRHSMAKKFQIRARRRLAETRLATPHTV
jgi:hypothetical protein